MDSAQPGHTVQFHGLKGAVHLNGTEGRLIRFIAKEKRWCVRCDNGEDVKAKPENLVLQHRSSSSNISARFDAFNNRTNAAINAFGGVGFFGGGLGPNSAAASDASSWANGLPQKDHYEWFSNCYQMRCDDDCAWGGCNLHGPYLPDATPDSIAKDFLIFCILAHRAEAVPANWDWKSFLKAATNHIPYAFEKADAKERWGSENYFNGASGAGRSLRYTGMQIYKSGVDEPGNSNEHEQAAREVDTNQIKLQDQVGGRNAWETLVRDLARDARFAGCGQGTDDDDVDDVAFAAGCSINNDVDENENESSLENIDARDNDDDSENAAAEPTVIQGWEHSTYAHANTDRYVYIGKDEDTREPMWLDYGNGDHDEYQSSSEGSDDEPTVIQGWEHSTYAHANTDRYAYMGKDEDTREPMWLDYGPKGSRK